MLAPPFQYYGSKSYLADWIARHLGTHRAYVEPFCGSAAVLMAKPPSRIEVINDLDRGVVTFYRALRDHPDTLQQALRETPYARTEFADAKADPYPVGADDVEIARRFMVRTNMSYSGVVDTGFSSPSGRERGSPTNHAVTFARRVDDLLARIAARLRGVVVESMDAMDLLDRWDSPDTAVYADPPYLGSTRVGNGAAGYVVDAPGAQFHAALLARLDRFRGQVLLSGYASPLYRRLLPRSRWTALGFERSAPAGGRAERAMGKRTEILWIKQAARS